MSDATVKVKHPAKFSPSIIDAMRDLLQECDVPDDARIIDPFSGVGRVHELGWPGTVGNEIEFPWCREQPDGTMTVCGDACQLPFRYGTFDAAVTSPTYGNRFADKHRARDGSVRRSYTHDLRASLNDPEYQLHPNNTGGMKWGRDYWRLHAKVYDEVWRVLKIGAPFLVNVSDFIRAGEVVRVVDWHKRTLAGHGFTVEREVEVGTPRMRYGANGELRVDGEKVLVCWKEAF